MKVRKIIDTTFLSSYNINMQQKVDITHAIRIKTSYTQSFFVPPD